MSKVKCVGQLCQVESVVADMLFINWECGWLGTLTINWVYAMVTGTLYECGA